MFSAAERERIVLTAYDAGCRHFDTAPAYGDGLCEAEAGRILTGRRHSVRLATKFGIPASDLGGRSIPLYFLGKISRKIFSSSYGREYGLRDFSPKAAIHSVDQSLKRLRTDYIDYLFFHEPRHADDLQAALEALEVLERLKREGKIRRFGLSARTSILLEAIRGGGPAMEAVQFELSDESRELLNRLHSPLVVSCFGIIRHLTAGAPGTRLDFGSVITWFRTNYPGVMPLFASNRPSEIERLGKVLSQLKGRTS